MTLRQKALAILVIGFGTLIIGIFFILEIVLTPRFEKLSRESNERNVLRVRDAVLEIVENQTQKAKDWAYWDDAYNFVESPSDTFVNSNMGSSGVKSLGINYAAYFLNSGEKVASSSFSELSDSLSMEDSINKYIYKFRSTYHFEDPKKEVSEIALIEGVPYIVSALPVLKSNEEGPIKGFLVFAKEIDRNLIAQVSKVTHLQVEMISLNEFDPEFKPSEKVYWNVVNLNEDFVRARLLFKDVFGRGSLGVETRMPRDVYKEGKQAGTLLVWSLLGGVFLIALWIVVVLEFSVLKRVLRLETSVKMISSKGDLALRAPVEGKDEITKLSVMINKMLFRIQRSKAALAVLLDHAEQGFFVVGANGLVQSGYSKVTVDFFKQSPQGKHFSELFLLDKDSTQELVDLIFSESLDFQSVVEIWPRQIKLQERSYRLDYRPIRDERGTLKSMMIAMTDITVLEQLERQQERERKLHQSLIKILGSRNYFQELKEMVDNLNASVPDEVEFKRKLHTLKGGLGHFDCESLASLCHHWEDQIGHNNSAVIRMNAANDVQVKFYEFLDTHDEILKMKVATSKTVMLNIQDLDHVLKNLKNQGAPEDLLVQVESLGAQDPAVALGWLSDSFVRTAEKMEKSVAPIHWESSTKIRTEDYDDLMKSLIHIVRNAADHGIEPPEVREMLGKPREGTLKASLSFDGEFYHLSFKDDGAGANIERIADKARSKGLEVPSTSDGILDLLFSEGFSTKSTVTETSGRGVGLDAVRTEARRLGGDVAASSESGIGMTFNIWFKKKVLSELEAPLAA